MLTKLNECSDKENVKINGKEYFNIEYIKPSEKKKKMRIALKRTQNGINHEENFLTLITKKEFPSKMWILYRRV